jgi:ABC-type multidrug transport system fused ATPase/permease subunit/thiamine kinase-like enzyme
MLIFEAATATLIPLLVAYVINYLSIRLAQIGGKPVVLPAHPLGFLGISSFIDPDLETVALVTLGIIIMTMINSLGDSLAEIYLAQAGRKVGYNMRVFLYGHLQKLSLTFHNQSRTGDILTRVTSDVEAVENFLISDLSDFLGSGLLIIFILTAMILNAWQVALVAVLIIPFMALISNYFTNRIKAASKRLRSSEGELASAAQEMLTSIRVVQVYGQGSYEQSLFSAQSQKAMNAALDSAAYQARFSWVVSVLGAVVTATVIWMGVWLIFRNPVSILGIGLLTAYIRYIQDMFKPTKKLIAEWNTLGKLYASIERIGDLIDLKPDVRDEPGAIAAPPFNGQLEFQNVFFTYPRVASTKKGADEKPRPTLNGLSFRIEPGQVVAVVGHTGAGKSTIVQLIPRLYDPNEGQILIDGHDIREFTLESLRAQMSMVLQESILFTGSIVENIAYGRPDATGAEIIAAAKDANADEFISKFPDGYYTTLGERGSNLSGGQRQRIAIARAFIRNTPILILDEPSTGLDAESTELVLQALRKLMKGKTTIIISHELNLIRDADKIIVIKTGEIEQIGTHDELIHTGGLYANLYAMQSGQRAIVESVPPKTKVEPPQPGKESKMVMPNLSVKELIASLDNDLPRSPLLQQKAPALAEAFNNESMKAAIRAALFDPAIGDYSIVECIAGKALYLLDHVINMQYKLKILDGSNNQTIDTLINARLFRDLAAAKTYLDTILTPIAAGMDDRPEIKPFARPVAIVERLNMTLSAFPIDGLIPTLVDATDPDKIAGILAETLPDALSGEFLIKDVHLLPAHYGRYKRCVLRYSIDGVQTETQTPQNVTVYGKVDSDGLGGLTVSVISALREKLRDHGMPYQFRIPRSLGYFPNFQLLLMEALPGNPFFKGLLKTWNGNGHGNGNGSHENEMTLEQAVRSCALIAATLHSSNIKLGRRTTFETQVAKLTEEAGTLYQVFPEVGAQIIAWINQTVAYAQVYPAMPLCFSHGDFTYTQLIFDGKDGGLVDFDSICQAEPAQDLGHYLAYQRLNIIKDQDTNFPFDPDAIERLCALFLDTYIDVSKNWIADQEVLRGRVAIYELLSLIRLALHSWEKMKGSRLKQTLSLIEERMACQTQKNLSIKSKTT